MQGWNNNQHAMLIFSLVLGWGLFIDAEYILECKNMYQIPTLSKGITWRMCIVILPHIAKLNSVMKLALTLYQTTKFWTPQN